MIAADRYGERGEVMQSCTFYMVGVAAGGAFGTPGEVACYVIPGGKRIGLLIYFYP
jgi:hypothetical protein